MTLRAMLDPAILPSYLSSAVRIARRSAQGPRRYQGDAPAICRAAIDACWTGDHFVASGGHFRQLWIRDLGFSAEPLVRSGYADRVSASLAWALDAWAVRGRVTTTIFPGRRARDVYTFGIDSLPLLLHALRASRAEALVRRHGDWLAREVARYVSEVIDPQTGLVRTDRRFSSHRDTVQTSSNAYANTMVVLLDRILRETGWFRSPVPPGATDHFLAAFWRGDRFVETPDSEEVTGDATVFPFWLGVASPELGLAAALRAARVVGLTEPLPLRYAVRRQPAFEDRVQRLFVPNYQGTSIWTSLGAIYLHLLRTVDPVAAETGIASYRNLVEREGTVWEVLDGSLRPYVGRLGLFRADEAMLWSVILLDLFGSAVGGATRIVDPPVPEIEGRPAGDVDRPEEA